MVDNRMHEWTGVTLLILFVLHHALNVSWHCTLTWGRYTPQRILMTATNVLLTVAMLTVVVSAVLVSRNVFDFLGMRMRALGRRIHMPATMWFFIFMSLHVGFIQTTEGNVVHYGFIEQFICQLGERYNIREIAYDRWNATMFVQVLQDDGFTMVPFGQGFKDMSPPTKELMRLVLERSINHDGYPVLRWNMDNVYVRTDPAGNLKIDKEKSTEKVDGAVASVMALDRAQQNLNGSSVYDERGLLTLDW